MNYMADEKIDIEIAYALEHKQIILIQNIDASLNARDAIKASEIQSHFVDLNLDTIDMGVFGKVIKDDYKLQQGDRIELYRPLIADPKEVRRQRAKKGLATKKGGGKK